MLQTPEPQAGLSLMRTEAADQYLSKVESVQQPDPVEPAVESMWNLTDS